MKQNKKKEKRQSKARQGKERMMIKDLLEVEIRICKYFWKITI